MQIVKWWIAWGLSRKSIFQELHLTVCLHVMWGGYTRSDMEKVEYYINTVWHEASCRCWLLIVSLCICMMDSRYVSTRLLCSLHLSHFVEQCVWETLKCSASLKDSAKVLEKLLAVKPSWVKLLVPEEVSSRLSSSAVWLQQGNLRYMLLYIIMSGGVQSWRRTDCICVCTLRYSEDYIVSIDKISIQEYILLLPPGIQHQYTGAKYLYEKHAGALNVPDMRLNSWFTTLFSSDCELKRH